MGDRRVIIVSEDAMVYEDVRTLETLPNFGSVLPRAARVNRVRSVYPTLTYPCHVSLLTGVYPDRHGIVNNEKETLGQLRTPWERYRAAIRGRTLFDAAKEKGLTTASVTWPVTGCDPAIDYLIDEYAPDTPEETVEAGYVKTGSGLDVVERIIRPNLPLNKVRTNPFPSIFANACACAMIREYKPHLLLLHPANIDAYRHQTGVFSPHVTHGLHEIDLWLGDLIKATRDAGVYDDTDFFIVSDHGQLNISRTVALNAILAERGLLRVDAAGNLTDFTAFAKSVGLSAHVYLKHPEDADAARETYRQLCAMRDDGVYGVERVYTAEEARAQERLAGGFSFVVESDGYTSFANDWTRPWVRNTDLTDYRFGRATHGHHPDKGPQPTLIAFGPDIREGAVVERCSLVDETATFAQVLGLEMPDIDGRALTALLR